MSTGARVLVARVGRERVAFDIAAVVEVIDAPERLPLPLAPRAVAGQMSWRGGFLPLFDAGVLLGVPRTDQAGVALVLAEVGSALWVDDAEDVWGEEDAAVRPVPAGTDRLGLLRDLLARGTDVVSHVDTGALVALLSATLRQDSTP